ncbi:MAG: hypothetical protein U9R19_10420 [Bacteroidota bacterium]|nr:hypothetical protein [Bacteroidota bacterium]
MDIRKKRQYSLFGFAAIIVIALLIPFKMPFSFKVLAKVYPYQEWNLKRDGAGSFYSEFLNNMTGFKNDFTNYEFERGDIANIHINNLLIPGTLVSKGDTIAHISSLLLKEQIANLKSEIEVEYAMLEASKSGSKIADIKVLEEELLLAQQKFAQARRKFKRINTLFSDSIIPDDKFETSEDNLKIAGIEVKILEKKLVSAKTGQKTANINLIMAKINSLDQQIQYLENRQLNYSIVSPISGMIDYNENNSALISISNTKKHIISAPIKVSYRKYIRTTTEMELSISGLDSIFKTRKIKAENSIGIVNNKQVIMLRASIDVNPGLLTPGMIMECKVNCEPITLLEYLKRSVNFTF